MPTKNARSGPSRWVSCKADLRPESLNEAPLEWRRGRELGPLVMGGYSVPVELDAACECGSCADCAPCLSLWCVDARFSTTVLMACLKMSCSWLLLSSTTEYLSKERMRPVSLTPLKK